MRFLNLRIFKLPAFVAMALCLAACSGGCSQISNIFDDDPETTFLDSTVGDKVFNPELDGKIAGSERLTIAARSFIQYKSLTDPTGFVDDVYSAREKVDAARTMVTAALEKIDSSGELLSSEAASRDFVNELLNLCNDPICETDLGRIVLMGLSNEVPDRIADISEQYGEVSTSVTDLGLSVLSAIENTERALDAAEAIAAETGDR